MRRDALTIETKKEKMKMSTENPAPTTEGQDNIVAAVPENKGAPVTHIDSKRVIQWVTLTRSCESPKLDFIKFLLREFGVNYEEDGYGPNGPIIYVPVESLALANEMVIYREVGHVQYGGVDVTITVDDLHDDHALFREWYSAQLQHAAFTEDDGPPKIEDEGAAWDTQPVATPLADMLHLGQHPFSEYAGLPVEGQVLPSSIPGMMFNINFVDVDSTKVSAVGILRRTDVGMEDLAQDIYFIRFKGGDYYLYQAHDDTPWAVGTWEGLLREARAKRSGDMSASVGRYVNQNIIGKHECGQATCKKLSRDNSGQWEIVLTKAEKAAAKKRAKEGQTHTPEGEGLRSE
jgi:hypothetical protein